MPSPPFTHAERRGLDKCVYRARVVRATYSAFQSDARIKSHDCAGMNGMQINDCARARLYTIEPLVSNGMLIYCVSYSRTPEIHDIMHSSATRVLYMFVQTPSLRVSERGLGTRLFKQ